MLRIPRNGAETAAVDENSPRSETRLRVISAKSGWKAGQGKLVESARFKLEETQMVNLLLSKVFLHVLMPVEAFDLTARDCGMYNDSSAIKTKA